MRGIYAAIRLSDLAAGANIETTHARITILNVGPNVNARVEEGIIDYSGHQGSARLFAGWEVNLKFTSPAYSGELSAIAGRTDPSFDSPSIYDSVEASVAKDAAFVCRADIKSQIRHRKQAGRIVYTFHQETPAIRLTSRSGPIVIDNSPSRLLQEEV